MGLADDHLVQADSGVHAAHVGGLVPEERTRHVSALYKYSGYTHKKKIRALRFPVYARVSTFYYVAQAISLSPVFFLLVATEHNASLLPLPLVPLKGGGGGGRSGSAVRTAIHYSTTAFLSPPLTESPLFSRLCSNTAKGNKQEGS